MALNALPMIADAVDLHQPRLPYIVEAMPVSSTRFNQPLTK
jgi:hypothetical protein